MWRFRRVEIPFIVLGIIGVVSVIVANPSAYIIPIIVFGVIFYLYKFPPGGRGPRGPRRRRRIKLRVIQGHKKDDEPPRYH